MTTPLRPLWRASLALVVALSFTLGIASVGCGPEKMFCPDSGNGVCPIKVDAGAPPPSDASDAPPQDMGSIFVPQG
jgi:hypothetical protein